MNTLRNLKQETFSTSALSMCMGACPPLLLLEVHDHLLGLADIEREVVALSLTPSL